MKFKKKIILIKKEALKTDLFINKFSKSNFNQHKLITHIEGFFHFGEYKNLCIQLQITENQCMF